MAQVAEPGTLDDLRPAATTAAPRRVAGRSRSGRPPSPVVYAFVVFILGAIALLAYAFVPRARVTLHPAVQPLDGAVELRADPALQAADLGGRRVPARVSYVVVDVNEQVLTQGRVPATDARATGSVTFANRAGGAATVPAGTVVTTPSGMRFATVADLAIDAAPGSAGRVQIQAVEPGEHGNVARLEISRIVGPLSTQLAVLNEEPTAGGGQSDTPMIVEADRERVRRIAAERARSEAIDRLRAEARGDETLVLKALDFGVLDEQFDRAVGEQATSFNYRLRAGVSASSVGLDDVRRVVRHNWQPTLPSGHFMPEQQLQISSPEVLGQEGRVILLRFGVQSLAVPRIDSDLVRARVRWRPAAEARRELARALPLAAEPQVVVEPGWASRALRVHVVLDLNEPTKPATKPPPG